MGEVDFDNYFIENHGEIYSWLDGNKNKEIIEKLPRFLKNRLSKC